MSSETFGVGERRTVALLREARFVSEALNAVINQFDLTADQWLLLELLVQRRRSGVSMTELRELTGLTGPTLTRVVDRLITDALAHREVDAHDRRRVLVHPSDEGRAMYRRSVKLVDDVESRLDRVLATDSLQRGARP